MRAPRRPFRRAGAALAALLAAAALGGASAAAAQPDSAIRILHPVPAVPGSDPEQMLRALRAGDSRIVRFGLDAPIAQRAWVPLTPEQFQQLGQARGLRMNGQLDAARRQLTAMLARVPHHPQVLTELGEVELAASNWAAIERLARQERAPGRDSLLLARPLSTALERLGRVRDAAQVAVEAWVASRESYWVPDALERLSPADAGVREALRTAVSRRPERTDMALVLASLDWRSGAGEQSLKTLGAIDGPQNRPPLRVRFAEELLRHGTGRDSSGAAEALLAVAGDARLEEVFRIPALQAAWQLLEQRGGEVAAAPRVAKILAGLPPQRTSPDLLVDVTRALRRGGHTAEARELLGRGGQTLDAGTAALERALADLRDGPPERALPALKSLAGSTPEATFRYAEALFFAGQPDSALTWYERVTHDPAGAWTGAALERTFLIEDAQPAAALPALGRMQWQEWRGEPRGAMALAESLYHSLPQGALWAHAALELSSLRETAGDARGALAPLLAVADSLPGDRLAPVARQRAGDLYLDKLHDERQALAAYEECLARYPRAWNAPEVRRRLEALRRERRF